MDKKIRSALDVTLSDFEPNSQCTDPYPWGRPFLDLTQEEKNALAPYSIFLAFVHFSKFPHAGRSEKIAWSIPVRFRGVPFVLMYAKFGFKIYPQSAEPIGTELKREFVGHLRRAIRFADKLVQPFAISQFAQGNVTIANHYYLFRHMYEFLRESATQTYASPPPQPEPIVHADGKTVGTKWHPFKPEREGFFLAAAALDAYFSLLEHSLVLLFAFTGFSPQTHNLSTFIRAKWSAKFKKIFDCASDRKAEQVFHALTTVKTRFRNPLSHGGFEDGHTFHFHLPGLGAVPMTMSEYKRSVHFSFTPIREESFQEICLTLDSVDQFLDDSAMRIPMLYVRSGLDVAFDKGTIAEYQDASKSEANMEAYIEAISWQTDQATNMDW